MNKNIISSVVGAGFFAVGYLGLAVPIAPALALGVASFVASELIVNGKEKQEERKELTFKEKIIEARKMNKHLKEMIGEIESDDTKNNLEEIYASSNKIINCIEKNELKNKTVNKYLDYYLPVCVKIVDRYDEIENQSLTSSDSKKFMMDGNKIIKDTNRAFKKILDSLYQSDIVNTEAEMKVFNSILKADGFDESILEVEANYKKSSDF